MGKKKPVAKQSKPAKEEPAAKAEPAKAPAKATAKKPSANDPAAADPKDIKPPKPFVDEGSKATTLGSGRVFLRGRDTAAAVLAGSIPFDSDEEIESTAAEASTGDMSIPDEQAENLIRFFAPDIPTPWSTFIRLRRSWGAITLGASQESKVFQALSKIPEYANISDSLPFVSAFLERHCPDLRPTRGTETLKGVVREGATFLMLAVVTGHVKLAEKCIELGADPNDTSFLSTSPSALQQHQNQRSNQHLRLTNVATSYMTHGLSPLFMACICEQLEVAEVLYKAGGDVDVIDSWGRTPLHATAALGSNDVVAWLLERGASRTALDRDGFRPGECCVGKVIPQLDRSVTLLVPDRRSMLCPCGSKKNRGCCACRDDANERWYLDRAKSSWIPDNLLQAFMENE